MIAQDNTKAYVVAENGLHLRAAPDKASKVKYKIPFNAPIVIFDTIPGTFKIGVVEGQWLDVAHLASKNEGYVFSGFVKSYPLHKSYTSKKSTTTSTKSKKVAQTKYNETKKGIISIESGVNMREAPKTKAAKIGVAHYNQEVEIKSTTFDNWHFIYNPKNGLSGYVYGKFVTIQE